jgi:hypothetical protein
MAKAAFTRDFDYPVPEAFGVTRAYRSGVRYVVSQRVIDAAIAKGALPPKKVKTDDSDTRK